MFVDDVDEGGWYRDETCSMEIYKNIGTCIFLWRISLESCSIGIKMDI